MPVANVNSFAVMDFVILAREVVEAGRILETLGEGDRELPRGGDGAGEDVIESVAEFLTLVPGLLIVS
jgi:hypothetical protein